MLKYNYLDMMRDGSMAMLRALTICMKLNYNISIDDNQELVQDECVDYYHLVVCSECTT